MKTSEISKIFQSDGYNVIETMEHVNGFGKIKILKAQKGKIFKNKIIIYVLNEFNENKNEELVKFIINDNKKNDLCLVLCNSIGHPNSEQTLYMMENGDGICMIHFVYYNLDTSTFIYNLDFNYHKATIVKSTIKNIINNNGPFEIIE